MSGIFQSLTLNWQKFDFVAGSVIQGKMLIKGLHTGRMRDIENDMDGTGFMQHVSIF